MFVVVSDLFSNEYNGGAELSTDSLISYTDKKVIKIKSKDVNVHHVSLYKNYQWIFTNFTQIDPYMINIVIKEIKKYHIIEYDYKYCNFRLPQHPYHRGKCLCENLQIGNFIRTFYKHSTTLSWMSKAQMMHYHEKFPELKNNNNFILSSIFSIEDMQTIRALSKSRQTLNLNNEMLLLGSSSWVKGFDNAREYCEERRIATKVVWGMEYHDVLKTMSEHRGIVYLPNGFDTCPRWTIEAKLLGCKMILNEFVQHKDEEWFNKSNEEIYSYLENQPKKFWKEIINE